MRQPARAVLGIVGVAAVAALLFDMLLLSRGLVLSMQDLLDRGGFDVRITATESLPGAGPRIRHMPPEVAAAIEAMPNVDDAVPFRFGEAEIGSGNGSRPLFVSFFGADAKGRRPWVIVEGQDLTSTGAPAGKLFVNRGLAGPLKRQPGRGRSPSARRAAATRMPCRW